MISVCVQIVPQFLDGFFFCLFESAGRYKVLVKDILPFNIVFLRLTCRAVFHEDDDDVLVISFRHYFSTEKIWRRFKAIFLFIRFFLVEKKLVSASKIVIYFFNIKILVFIWKMSSLSSLWFFNANFGWSKTSYCLRGLFFFLFLTFQIQTLLYTRKRGKKRTAKYLRLNINVGT